MFERKRNEVYTPVYIRPREPQRRMRYTEGQEVATMTTKMPEATGGRFTGKVSAFQKDKGFGFINHPETGRDYFFHKSEALDIWDEIQQYDTVTFTPGTGPKGPRASQVELL